MAVQSTLSGFRVERHDARMLSADVRDHPAVLDERRTGGAKEALRHAELARRVHAPDFLAAREIHGVELAFGAKCVDGAICAPRTRANATRPPIEVTRRMLYPPRCRSTGHDGSECRLTYLSVNQG